MKEKIKNLFELLTDNKFFLLIIFVVLVGGYFYATNTPSQPRKEEQKQRINQLILDGIQKEEQDESFGRWNEDLYRQCIKEYISYNKDPSVYFDVCSKESSQRVADYYRSL